MQENILVIIAAGINTNRSKNLFKGLKEEIEKRYGWEGKSVRFVEVYPLGEVKNTTVVRQVLEVGVHMHRGTGGAAVVRAVRKHMEGASRIILIGHSGGGQAIGDALPVLERKGISIHHAVQIGAPSVPVLKKYVHKFTRVQTRTDFVCRNIHTGTEAISHSINPLSGLIASLTQMHDRKMPEIRYVDLNIENQPWGGHSAYFSRHQKNRFGVDNVTLTVGAFWDKIK